MLFRLLVFKGDACCKEQRVPTGRTRDLGQAVPPKQPWK